MIRHLILPAAGHPIFQLTIKDQIVKNVHLRRQIDAVPAYSQSKVILFLGIPMVDRVLPPVTYVG